MNDAAYRTRLGIALALASVLLIACENKSSQQTAGQKLDQAIAKTEQVASEVKVKTEDLAEKARAHVDASVTRAEPALKQGAAEAKEALKEAGTTVAATLDDTAITAAVSAGLAKDPDLSAVKIDVHTQGGVVTLSGPAPNAAAKTRAGEIARGVKSVNSVNNQLVVAG